MKIAFSSYSGYGAWLIKRLVKERHDVTYFLNPPAGHEEIANVCKGLVPKPRIIKNHDYSNFDLSVFDLTGKGRRADASYEVCPTIGDRTVNCDLEDNRAFGIQVMEQAGIEVPPYEEFANAADAIKFARKEGKRYVYKPSGGQEQDADTTYVSHDALDLIGFLERLDPKVANVPCILQEFVKGTEVSVEGWFNGTDFYLLNSTLEDKKFMNDNKGPNTGCSGNLVMLIKSTDKIYRMGLEKAKDILQSIDYVGMIDLNTIVTEDKAYGLEWTPRFGYDASATFLRMYAGDYGEMLASVASGGIPDALWSAEYGVSARLTIPPYPSEIKGKHKSEVVCAGLNAERDYLYDVMLDGSANSIDPGFKTVGITGYVASPIVVGNDVKRIWDELYHIVDHKIKIPQMQVRTDCDKSSMEKLATLKTQGWL